MCYNVYWNDFLKIEYRNTVYINHLKIHTSHFSPLPEERSAATLYLVRLLIRINNQQNKNNWNIAINVPRYIYLKVLINAHRITRTFAKIYDNGLQVILSKLLPSTTNFFDIMSYFAYAE